MSDERQAKGISVIANPLAGEKLAGKCLKLVKKAAKEKGIRRGVKEVCKALRKKEKGLVIIAGNITPIDVITHIPVLCEEADLPYIYVPAKDQLGAAADTKRPTSVILVLEKDGAGYDELMRKIVKAVVKITPSY
mmetsp:Transcript_16797/g.23580  ORF Transcript_16797/g.23580 Transcript_16797/m.23580 type:complete len:135 (+) Transcript_16797:24-428(+)|eukprot:CAMPEP_0175101600 /NCGR_PEP_ID=MMETSP0086_2-20121207/7910_1 /TAXON_ID=136419 /ORGANISM="Unknown Unknown, Strain D1" /LENGTH=134 /DNA_ID=CAMNT_0016376195 /DNA_START=42 /DNA_END=446 /DNA_ORIENTATION=+